MAFGPTGSNWLVMKYSGLRGGPLCLIKRPGVLQSPNCKRLLKPFLVQTKGNDDGKGKYGGWISKKMTVGSEKQTMITT